MKSLLVSSLIAKGLLSGSFRSATGVGFGFGIKYPTVEVSSLRYLRVTLLTDSTVTAEYFSGRRVKYFQSPIAIANCVTSH